ncbi:DUF1365 domain-containing protein [Chitinimonas naiadis]
MTSHKNPAGSAVQICRGHVMHVRHRPVRHRFRYPVFFLHLCLTAPASQIRCWGLFGFNRPGIISFHAKDHGDRDGHDLLAWLDRQLARAGLHRPEGEVWLQTFPRVLGYVFKPVSFWYCHDKRGELRILIAEVNNTFGERHQYVLCAPDEGPIMPSTELICRKHFHVSPFCEVKGSYRFRVRNAGARKMARIDYFDHASEPKPLLETVLWGTSHPLTTSHLFRTLLRTPLLTLGITFRIHWQALHLWWRGVPFFRKPQAPEPGLTHNNEASL